MFSLLTNPIVSHLLAACIGAGGAWYATHRTAVAVAAAAIKSDVAAVKTDLSK